MHFKPAHSILWTGMAVAVMPFIILPLLSMVTMWTYPSIWPDTWSTSNWNLFFRGQADIRQSFGLTIGVAMTTALVSTVAGFLLSRAMVYQKWARSGVFLSLLPVTASPVLFATILVFYFNLAGLSGTIAGVIIAQWLITIPFSIIYFISFWGKRIYQMEQAAANLGTPFLHILKEVVVPIARPFLFVCFFQTFLISWFEFGLTSVVGSGKVQTLTIKVFYYVQEASTFMAALASALLILPPAVMLWFNRKFVFKQTVS